MKYEHYAILKVKFQLKLTNFATIFYRNSV